MARVVHFEIPVDNPDRAVKFYTDVFGWKIEKWEGPIDYWLITTGEENEPGINGALTVLSSGNLFPARLVTITVLNSRPLTACIVITLTASTSSTIDALKSTPSLSRISR